MDTHGLKDASTGGTSGQTLTGGDEGILIGDPPESTAEVSPAKIDLPRQQSGAWRRIWNRNDKVLGSIDGWIRRHPLLVILLAHTVFSIGIWNARDGYAEEAHNVAAAFRILQSHHPSLNVYRDLIALTLIFLPDPITALTFLKYISSLLSTVALYLGLSSFSKNLRPGAIIFACLVWIASPLHAPYLVSTSLSLFTFAIMLFGIDCLLPGRSIPRVFGFYVCGMLAASLRPEYLLPVVLVTLILTGRVVWRGLEWLKSRFGWSRLWSCAGAVCLALAVGAALWINPPAPVVKGLASLDNYALFGLGQCYAEFYHKEHPEEVFAPMTEYRAILNRKFDNPAGFCAAIRNNPLEAVRYLTLNARNNLWQSVPEALVSRDRVLSEYHVRHQPFRFVRAILIAGALLGVVRLCRVGWKRDSLSWGSMFAFVASSPAVRKLCLLLLLLFTSSVAIVLLVGSPRYYFCWVPLFYLGVAYCANSVLRAVNIRLFESIFVTVSFILLCSSNYLAPRPNREFDAVRQIALQVKENPAVGGWWSEPDTVIALNGKARAISLWSGIHQTDIENGKIDILMLDANFRSSKTWADQRDFFERLERQPEMCGFKKAKGIPAGRFDIYYKPNPVQSGG